MNSLVGIGSKNRPIANILLFAVHGANQVSVAKRLLQGTRFVFSDAIFTKEEYTKNLIEFPTYETLIEMESYGLIAYPTGLARVLNITSEGYFIISGHTAYRICHENTPKQLKIPATPLSPQGREIFNLVNPEINENYLRAIAKFMNDNGNFKLERAKIIQKFSDDRIHPAPWVLVEPQ